MWLSHSHGYYLLKKVGAYLNSQTHGSDVAKRQQHATYAIRANVDSVARGAGQKRICAVKCLYRFKTLIPHTSLAITSIERGTRDLLLGWWPRRDVEEFQRNGC